jgi:ribosomal protein S11
MINIEKKTHFFFGNKIKKAKLIFELRYSNIFVTLLDLRNKVICCKTSGCDKICSNKKKRISMLATDNIVNMLITFFNIYEIKNLIIFFRTMPNKSSFRLVHYLERCGMKILRLKVKLSYPHNGVRVRKLRRV